MNEEADQVVLQVDAALGDQIGEVLTDLGPGLVADVLLRAA